MTNASRMLSLALCSSAVDRTMFKLESHNRSHTPPAPRGSGVVYVKLIAVLVQHWILLPHLCECLLSLSSPQRSSPTGYVADLRPDDLYLLISILAA